MQTIRFPRLVFGIFLMTILVLSSQVWSHQFQATTAKMTLDGANYRLELVCDLDALALGVPQDTDDARLASTLVAMAPRELAETEAKLRDFLQRRLRIRFGGEPSSFQLSFPEIGQTGQDSQPPSFFGTRLVMSGSVPHQAQSFTFFASRSFPPVHLRIIHPGYEEPAPILLEQGQHSPPLSLKPEPRSAFQVFVRYGKLGFLHILPKGLDHILFVLGLFLFCRQWKPLLWQVSAFTVAHTITLALSSYKLVTLPSGPVEVLIALSIVYVAVENMATRELKAHRLGVVFAFGLLHGLGFAGVLGELGLPRGQFAPALISFNIGVELGQLAVIALAFLAVGWFRGHANYRKLVVIPLSALIGLTGLFWVIQRALPWF